MRFGIREICDVVFKAKSTHEVGNKTFYKNEPVIYFDTLKTSSLEGAATTVYATGGRGNTRLVAWEGERTLTFTMEDALISPAGFMILSGAGLIEASESATIKTHATEIVEGIYNSASETITFELLSDEDTSVVPYYTRDGEDYIYAMIMKDGEKVSEPYIAVASSYDTENELGSSKTCTIKALTQGTDKRDYTPSFDDASTGLKGLENGAKVMLFVDYYIARKAGVQQINITPDSFGGNYYVEASTLFRTEDGVDLPAEFVIPNCKVQSNFTFSMASSGDPSTFTFTLDAFPDYTRFDQKKKVLAAIQVIEDSEEITDTIRTNTRALRN